MFFYLHCGQGFNCLYGGETSRCLCMVIPKTVSVNTKHHVTPDTSEYHRSLHAPEERTRHRRFVLLWPEQCLLWCVSSLLVLLEAEERVCSAVEFSAYVEFK